LFGECGRRVRSALDENYELFRAAELTSDLLMLKTMHRGKYPDVDTDVEPKTLYEDLIKMGYDWTVLLNTVNHWSFLEMPSEKPQITIMDLLRMRHGLYVPFWFAFCWQNITRVCLVPTLPKCFCDHL
jgi:hypothetical protein